VPLIGWAGIENGELLRKAVEPESPRSRALRFTHTRAFLIGHVTFGLLDGAFELRREFQVVLDQIIKPATDLTKLCLRKFAELAFHLLNFAHMQMIQRILLKFKPGASQSSAIGMIAAESEFRR